MAKEYKDRFLPTQFGGDEWLYAGAPEHLYRDLYGALTKFGQLVSPRDEFEISESDKFSVEQLASSPLGLQLLRMMVLIRQPKRILEIGVFVGISTMTMAKALPEGGEVVAIEKFDHFAEIANQNFKRNGLASRVKLILGDATEVIPTLYGKPGFDMIFLDGHKEKYSDYFESMEPLLNPGGLFIIDDVLFDGDALNPKPKTEKGAGCLRFLETSLKYRNYNRILLPIGSGVMLMLKQA